MIDGQADTVVPEERPRFCQECGHALAGANFCPECGRPVMPEPARSATGATAEMSVPPSDGGAAGKPATDRGRPVPRILLTVLGTAVLCAAVAGAGYAVGHSGGPNLERARAAGARIGLAQGSDVAKRHGYALGYKLGYSRGYKGTYPVSFHHAYKAAVQ